MAKTNYPWQINIYLPKDRSKDGTLEFRALVTGNNNPEVKFLHECKCHAEGINNYPWNHDSGDTPTGSTCGETIRPGSNKVKFGPYRRINFIKPMTGNMEEAYDKHGRSELQIHGGRDQNKLWNTEGCIRIFDKDIKIITDYIDNSCREVGYIFIDEI